MKDAGTARVASLYIHVPFCAIKCAYCAFYSEPSSGDLINRYVDALVRELEIVAPDLKPKTIFFGGGTPSLLNLQQWQKIFRAMESLGILGAEEFTVECNPATVSPDKAKLFRDFGVNRISMGVQSLDAALLERLGRVHSREMVFKSYDILRHAGFDNLNIDLMFAIPGQTMEIWRATLNEVLALGSEHLSSYEVIYEDDTPLFAQLKAGKFDVNEDLACEMYEELANQATAAGFRQYEVANFARDARSDENSPENPRIEPRNLTLVGGLLSNSSCPLAVPSPLPSDGRGEGQGEVRVHDEVAPLDFEVHGDGGHPIETEMDSSLSASGGEGRGEVAPLDFEVPEDGGHPIGTEMGSSLSASGGEGRGEVAPLDFEVPGDGGHPIGTELDSSLSTSGGEGRGEVASFFQPRLIAGIVGEPDVNSKTDDCCSLPAPTSDVGVRDSIPTFACKHNVNYWRGGSFYGLGPSATSYVRGVRTKNWSNTQLYCDQLEKGNRAIESREELPPLKRAGETAAFGLRMNAGWDFEEFQRVSNMDLRDEWPAEMKQLAERGWAKISTNNFHLTKTGLRFADAAAELFLR